MSDNTKIEWSDATWNPVTGCDEVSPGCDHCYAKTFAERWRSTPGHYFENGFDVLLRPDKLDQPLRWKKPRKIFVNSMSDLFHKEIPGEYIASVFAVMALTPQHTYQVLTKRHGRMRSLLRGAQSNGFHDAMAAEMQRRGAMGGIVQWPLPNVWLGVSVEDQPRADLRIPALLDTPAAVRFLACEPLLGPVDFSLSMTPWDPASIDWVIVGGESGHGSRLMHPSWARSLRDQCRRVGVPFLYKQWGQWAPAWGRPVDGDRWVTPDGESEPWTHGHGHMRIDGGYVEGSGDAILMRRASKAQTGRELDGRTWDEYPEHAA